MTETPTLNNSSSGEPAPGTPLRTPDSTIASRIAASALSTSTATSNDDFRRWFDECGKRNHTQVELIDLDDLDGWCVDPGTGNISHRSGKFFTVEGLDVHSPGGRVPHWSQPIINQREIGILGILAKEFDGVLHFLIQGKVEPGNCNGVQLSPTVQATRSNYTRVHKGKPVPYLEYFLDTADHRTLADVLQSEQGAWFLQKRNRNMVIEVVDDEVEAMEDFCWLTLRQLHDLLREPNIVNMDTRTVLSCLPLSSADLSERLPTRAGEFTASIVRSCTDAEGAVHTPDEILSWITNAKTRHEIIANRVSLNEVSEWHRSGGAISHEDGLYFSVVGLNIQAGGREVHQWSQPVFKPHGEALSAFLVRRFGGVLHALVHTRLEPGYLDVIELAPTVQCGIENYLHLPAEQRLPFLDDVLDAEPERIRFDTVQSEEGGRFYHARVRYLIVETDVEVAPSEHPDHRWMPLHQLVGLLRHSHYLNVQARSLVACLYSLIGFDEAA